MIIVWSCHTIEENYCYIKLYKDYLGDQLVSSNLFVSLIKPVLINLWGALRQDLIDGWSDQDVIQHKEKKKNGERKEEKNVLSSPGHIPISLYIICQTVFSSWLIYTYGL